jgi:hypothetical protein
MYASPSIHLELAKQRHLDMLAEARRYNVSKEVGEVGDVDGPQRLRAVKGVFAGILATVASVARPKPASEPAATPC